MFTNLNLVFKVIILQFKLIIMKYREYKEELILIVSNITIMKKEEDALKKSCWKGYKKEGTKTKGGKKVNNCIPVKKKKEK